VLSNFSNLAAIGHKYLNKIPEIRTNNTSVITEIDLYKEMDLVRTNLHGEIEETGAQINEDFSAVDVIFRVKPYTDSILTNLISNSIQRLPKIPDIVQSKLNCFHSP
jgi:hypothetical protein